MYYDLHIHSALSPCGDNDMTIHNILNMAKLKELDVVALTDHNSCRNTPAFLHVAKEIGITALAGMEINTAEEVHAVCLFPALEDALLFDAYVYERLPAIKNDPAIFGEQRILNEKDEIIGYEEKLLVNATEISFFELHDLVRKYNGIYFPAHIDRASFSLLSNLGMVPEDVLMDAYELSDLTKKEAIVEQNKSLQDLPLMVNSDAHYLWDIAEPVQQLSAEIKEKLKLL